MQVNLRLLDDGSLHVRILNVGGGSMGRYREVVLQPGDKWQGWKYSRLVRLGDGDHDLLSKDEREQLS